MYAKVIELFITLNDEDKTRKSVKTITVDKNGIIGDKFHGKNIDRSILLTSTDSYSIAQENSIEIATGSLGENILIDINPYNLVAGDRLSIGNVVLEITQNCTLCKGLSAVNTKLPKLLKNDRGIFAKVIECKSEIHIGDKVEFLNH
jgi:MOSC domain-containing protein YiiM